MEASRVASRALEVGEHDFESVVREGIVLREPWLREPWASWCGPCLAFTPILESAAARHPDIVFGKVDTEAEPGGM